MSERKSFIEIYDEASMGNRVNIILDNFPYFNRIIDSYENCIRDIVHGDWHQMVLRMNINAILNTHGAAQRVDIPLFQE